MHSTHAPSPAAPPDAALDRATMLAALRARTARLEGAGRVLHAAAAIPICEGLGLPGGGLARGALHEVLATSPGCGAAFCAVLLARTGGTVLWISNGQDDLSAWPPGLARHGLLPSNLILVRADRAADALWAMEEALRCPAVAGALLSQPDHARLDLTATRRLQLAAEAGGALGLLLRPDAPQIEPTAATTRWRIGAASGGSGPEEARWAVELLRAKGGRPGGPWAVTWRAGADASTGALTLDESAAETIRETAG